MTAGARRQSRLEGGCDSTCLTMGTCCSGPKFVSATPGELILVQRNSSNQCVFEHAQALQNGSSSPVPLTLRSHLGMAITSKSNSNRTMSPFAYESYLNVDLGIGPQEDALCVFAIKSTPYFHLKSFGGYFILNSKDQKLFEVNPIDCCGDSNGGCCVDCCVRKFYERTSVQRVCGWNDSIRYRVEGREFIINSYGTISPAGPSGGSLVLGINDGWQQETITPDKRELLLVIEPGSPLYIISEVGVNESGQRRITGLRFVHEPIGERGFTLSSSTSCPHPPASPTRSAPFFLKRGEVITGIEGFLRLTQFPRRASTSGRKDKPPRFSARARAPAAGARPDSLLDLGRARQPVARRPGDERRRPPRRRGLGNARIRNSVPPAGRQAPRPRDRVLIRKILI